MPASTNEIREMIQQVRQTDSTTPINILFLQSIGNSIEMLCDEVDWLREEIEDLRMR